MTKIELAKKLVEEKYSQYNIKIPIDKLPWSGEIIETKLNDGTIEFVDRMVEFALCALYSYYYIDRYCYALDPQKGPIPLKLFDFQKNILDDFQTNRKNIFKKCLTENNFIQTDRGYISIKDASIGDKIKTIIDGKIVDDEIIDFWKNEEEKTVLEIRLNNGSKIECTEDHKVMTIDGWKEAQNLIIDDELITDFKNNYDMNSNKVASIKEIGYKDTYDISTKTESFLANGCLVHNCRQVGASVITGCYALWRANFHRAQIIKIISLGLEDAKEFKEKTIDINYYEMPGFLKTKTTRDGFSKTRLKLVNQSNLRVLPKSKNAGRGGTPSLVIIDEAAFNEWMDDIWKSIEPSLDRGGDIVVISTTNGVGNWYHLTYTRAEERKNEFNAIFIPWWRYPGRDNPWLNDVVQKERSGEWSKEDINKFTREKELEQLSYEGPIEKAPWLFKKRANAKNERDFQQEILASFLGSGETVITPKTIQHLEDNIEEPKWVDRLPRDVRQSPIPGLHVWRDVKQEHLYMITADTATGHGKDYSTFHVIDVYDNEQVAEFKNLLPTDDFGVIIKRVARYYNGAFVAIETNHPGPAVFNEIYRSKIDPYYNVYVKHKGKGLVSWETTTKSRVLLIEDLFKDLENRYTKIHSKRLVEEIKVFQWNDSGKAEALSGYNDDLVISYSMYAHLKDKSMSSTPIGISTSDVNAIDLKEVDNKLTWEERDEMIMDYTGVDLDTYFWLQDKPVPEDYKNYVRKQREEEIEGIDSINVQRPPEWLKERIKKINEGFEEKQ